MESVESFLEPLKILGDKYLQDCEKKFPKWEQKMICRNYHILNEFYVWVKTNYSIKNTN